MFESITIGLVLVDFEAALARAASAAGGTPSISVAYYQRLNASLWSPGVLLIYNRFPTGGGDPPWPW